jgi:hypothetical protein
MDTPRTDLIRALEHFWNAWASARNDVVLILCSSATSWILKKILHNRGGLYNRLTGQIRLNPFTLAECKEYAERKKLAFSDMQIMELLSQNPVFCEYTLPKMRRLSNDLEFILRLFSYLVADWCIDVYSRVYGVNKNIFFVNENNSEYENTVGKLNAFKNNLLTGHADISNIIIYGFSAEKREIRAIRGELFEIYQNCSAILKQ